MQGLDLVVDKLKDFLLKNGPKVIFAVLLFAIFYFMAKLLRKYTLKFYTKVFKKQRSVANFISTAVYVAILLFGGFASLEVLGLEDVLTKMIAGAGVLGIVAGFAFKEIGSNIFAGVLIGTQRPFKIGDWVEIAGTFGEIETIGAITTSIKTTTGQEVFVPNQMIYQASFTNFSNYGKRRVVLQSGVSYGDDLEKVKAVALDEVNKIKTVLKDQPVDFYFTGIGSSAYDFEVRFWIKYEKQTDYLEAMNETIMRIKKRFEQEDISLAYSVMTLDFGVKGGVNLFDKPVKVES